MTTIQELLEHLILYSFLLVFYQPQTSRAATTAETEGRKAAEDAKKDV